MDRIATMYLVMLIAWLLLQGSNSYQLERIFGRKAYRVRPIFAILFALPLVYFAWKRDLSIGDSATYMRTMNMMPSSWEGIVEYLGNYPKDPGYSVFIWILKVLGLSWREMFLVIAILQITPLIYVYRRYSSNYYLSMLLFLISTDYISWMQNGVRQFLAVSIIFAATGWILDGKYFRSILVIIFASLFHQSALVMIPCIFLVQGEALNVRMIGIVFLFFTAVVFVESFTNILDSMLEKTQYSNMVTDFTTGEFAADNGTNPLRVLVYSVPVLLALLIKGRGCKTMPPIINLSVNMSLLSAGFYLISMVTSGIFIGRIPIYFSLYNYILIPWEINILFEKSQRSIVTILMITLYLVFSMIQYTWI